MNNNIIKKYTDDNSETYVIYLGDNRIHFQDYIDMNNKHIYRFEISNSEGRIDFNEISSGNYIIERIDYNNKKNMIYRVEEFGSGRWEEQ